jgi:hypothetical protein
MPQNKLERFTQRARRVLSLAQEEAERFRHNYIGTEHLLLGLFREEGGISGRVLRDLGLEHTQIEELIEKSAQASTARKQGQALELSEGTKRVLELAVDEARRMGHLYIGTEHLLLGLARQSEGVAIEILQQFGVSPEEVRRQTRRVIQESPAQKPEQPAESTSTESGLSSGSIGYQVMREATIKILDMVRTQAITTNQGAELLNALQPHLKLTPGEQVQIAGLINLQAAAPKRRLQIKIINRETGENRLELSMQMESAITTIDRLLLAIMDTQVTNIAFDTEDGKGRIEIQFVEDNA